MQVNEPVVDKKSEFNFFTSIWLVPIIALIIGGWLIYEHFSKLGPEIKIEFKNSGGLQAGVSEVKFRDVPVGKVTKIKINTQKEGVIVYARLNKEVEPFLNETTKFWIVKPEVDYSGIRGLDTLLSGSYIKMYATKKSKKKKREFIGLDKAFVDVTKGVYYTLKSKFPIKIKPSTPLYYKGIQVGDVESISLDLDSKDLIIKVKVDKKYASLVNETTKFWIQSLINLKINDNRLDVNMAPLPTLLLGGIEFDTQFDKKYNPGTNKIFNLYKNEYEAKLNKLKFSKPIIKKVVLTYSGDVSSLEAGMPIKYKGFRVGVIDTINIEYDKNSTGFRATCFGNLDLSNFNTSKDNGFENFKELVQKGLVAKLKKSNPIFNKTIIELEEDNTTKSEFKFSKKYNAYLLPTKDYKPSDILAQLSDIIDKFNNLNLKNTLNNVDELLVTSKKSLDEFLTSSKVLVKKTSKTLDSINKVISNKEFKNISKNLNRSLRDLSATLKTTKRVIKGYSNSSLFGAKVDALLKELHNTTEQTNRLINKLNKKPNALIFGD